MENSQIQLERKLSGNVFCGGSEEPINEIRIDFFTDQNERKLRILGRSYDEPFENYFEINATNTTVVIIDKNSRHYLSHQEGARSRKINYSQVDKNENEDVFFTAAGSRIFERILKQIGIPIIRTDLVYVPR